MRILAGATTALRRIVDFGLVVLIVVVLLAVVLGKGAPLVGRQSIVIGGGSMEPAIGLGSAIVVRPIDAANLAVGDVVSMQIGPERTTYTHRIVAIVDRDDGRWILTRGDANAAADPSLVPASAVIGRVELVIPYAGYVLALLSLPMGVLFVLGLAATLLAIAWLLESLELEPRPVRGSGGSAAAPRHEILGAPPEAAFVAVLDSELLHGEPIAARPLAAGRLGPATPGAFATQILALDGPPSVRDRAAPLRGRNPVPASAAVTRPTAREQIARSRDVRNRRASWLLGRGHDRPTTD